MSLILEFTFAIEALIPFLLKEVKLFLPINPYATFSCLHLLEKITQVLSRVQATFLALLGILDQVDLSL